MPINEHPSWRMIQVYLRLCELFMAASEACRFAGAV